MRFLIDTGAALSLLPIRKIRTETDQPAYDLVAANGTPIATYGTESRRLTLTSDHTFHWDFLVADVGQPILGADFLSAHDLLVDTRRRRLQHQPSSSYLPAVPYCSKVPVISHLRQETPFDVILHEFPQLLKDDLQPKKVNHSIEQTIVSSGPPCFARPRCLPPERLQAAQQEFDMMI